MSRRVPFLIRRLRSGDYSAVQGWEAALVDAEGSYSGNELKVDSTDRDVVEALAYLWRSSVRGPFQYRPDAKPYWRTSISGQRAQERYATLREILCDRRAWDWLEQGPPLPGAGQ